MDMTAADSEGLIVDASPSAPGSASATPPSPTARLPPPTRLTHIITPPPPLPPPAPHTPTQQVAAHSLHALTSLHAVALPPPPPPPPTQQRPKSPARAPVTLQSVPQHQGQSVAVKKSAAEPTTSSHGGAAAGKSPATGATSASSSSNAPSTTTTTSTPKRIVSSSNGKSCCIDGCTSKQYDRDGNYVGLSFFSMTEKSGRESLWKEYIHRKNCKKHFICELHFKADDIQMTLAGRKKVKNGARPTRNLNGNFAPSGGAPSKSSSASSRPSSSSSSASHASAAGGDSRGGGGVAWRPNAHKFKGQSPSGPKEFLIAGHGAQPGWKKEKSYGSPPTFYHPYPSTAGLSADSKRFKSDAESTSPSGVATGLDGHPVSGHVIPGSLGVHLPSYRHSTTLNIPLTTTRPAGGGGAYFVHSDAIVRPAHYLPVRDRGDESSSSSAAAALDLKASLDDAKGRTLIMQSLSAPVGHRQILEGGAGIHERRHTEPPSLRTPPLHLATPPTHVKVDGSVLRGSRSLGDSVGGLSGGVAGAVEGETLVFVEDTANVTLVAVTEDHAVSTTPQRRAGAVLPPSPAPVFGADGHSYLKWATSPRLVGHPSPPAVLRGIHSPPSSPAADPSSPPFESPLASPHDHLHHHPGVAASSPGAVLAVPASIRLSPGSAASAANRNLTSHFPYYMPPTSLPHDRDAVSSLSSSLSSPVERLEIDVTSGATPSSGESHATPVSVTSSPGAGPPGSTTALLGKATPVAPPPVAPPPARKEMRNPLMVLAEAAALLARNDGMR